jgi:site-specific DNA-cytosine methylase
MARKPKLTALELFCGIGGFAAAAAGTNVRVVDALDQSPVAAVREVLRDLPGFGDPE